MTDIIVKDIKNGSEYYYGGGAEVSAEDVSYDNTTSGAVADNLQDAMDEVFQSVSNGKELIADAITDKGVSTSATDSFQTMADNIRVLAQKVKQDAEIFMPLSFTMNIALPGSTYWWGQVGDVIHNNKYYSFYYYAKGSSEYATVGMFVKEKGQDPILVEEFVGSAESGISGKVRFKIDSGDLKISFLIHRTYSGGINEEWVEVDFTNSTYVNSIVLGHNSNFDEQIWINSCGISDDEKMDSIRYTTMSRVNNTTARFTIR